MTPENASKTNPQPAGLTPENAALLAEYADHLRHLPLRGHTPRTYLGAVRGYLAWLQDAQADGDPLKDAAAKDWAVRDYRSYLVTVAKRATATVNKDLAALADFYTWRGLGPPQGVKRHQVAGMRRRHWSPGRSSVTCGPSRPARAPATGPSRCCRCTPVPASPRSAPWTSPTCA